MTAGGGNVFPLGGRTRVVGCDAIGDVDAAPNGPHGVFHRGERYLSRWRLTVGGRAPELLFAAEVDPATTVFYLVPPDDGGPPFSIVRWRSLGDGLHEELVVTNHSSDALVLELRIEAAPAGETRYGIVEPGRLVLGASGDAFVRETSIACRTPDALLTEDGVRFLVEVAPRGEWTTGVDVRPVAGLPSALRLAA